VAEVSGEPLFRRSWLANPELDFRYRLLEELTEEACERIAEEYEKLERGVSGGGSG
jgi:hypothetical protein